MTTRGIEDLPNVIEFYDSGALTRQISLMSPMSRPHPAIMTGPPTPTISSEDKKVVAFFNGEIYNFNEFGDYQPTESAWYHSI